MRSTRTTPARAFPFFPSSVRAILRMYVCVCARMCVCLCMYVCMRRRMEGILLSCFFTHTLSLSLALSPPLSLFLCTAAPDLRRPCRPSACGRWPSCRRPCQSRRGASTQSPSGPCRRSPGASSAPRESRTAAAWPRGRRGGASCGGRDGERERGREGEEEGETKEKEKERVNSSVMMKGTRAIAPSASFFCPPCPRPSRTLRRPCSGLLQGGVSKERW